MTYCFLSFQLTVSTTMANILQKIGWQKRPDVWDLVCCPLCTNPIHDLRHLPCGHVFCHTCLEDYKVIPSTVLSRVKVVDHRTVHYCPVCLTTVNLQSTDKKLPAGHWMKALVKTMQYPYVENSTCCFSYKGDYTDCISGNLRSQLQCHPS